MEVPDFPEVANEAYLRLVENALEDRICLVKEQLKNFQHVPHEPSSQILKSGLEEELHYLEGQYSEYLAYCGFPSTYGYGATAYTSYIAECLLRVTTMYLYAIFSQFESKNPFIGLDQIWIRVMYGISIAQLCTGGYACFIFAPALAWYVWFLSTHVFSGERFNGALDGKKDSYSAVLAIITITMIVFDWWLPWLFWAGFLHVAKEK
jgi:hypothetical protein